MFFKYRVNYDGTYYEAGQNVPIEKKTHENQEQSAAVSNVPNANARRYTLDELQDMTVREIRAAAAELGFEIKKTARDDVVDEFMEKQNQV